MERKLLPGESLLPESTPLLPLKPLEAKRESKTAYKNVVVIGDSTIDNKGWIGIGGILLNRFKEWLGIRRDDMETRIRKSRRFLFPPELSVVENLQKALPSYKVWDYTNDGFNTLDVLEGEYRDSVFHGALALSFPPRYFFPLMGEEAPSLLLMSSVPDQKGISQLPLIASDTAYVRVSNKCSLLLRSSLDKKSLPHLAGELVTGYVRVKNNEEKLDSLFYVDPAKKTCEEIKGLTPDKLKEFDNTMKPTDEVKILTKEELQNIKSITGHTAPHLNSELDTIYYINKVKKTCTEIKELTPDKLKEFDDKIRRPSTEPTVLIHADDLKQITSITGHTREAKNQIPNADCIVLSIGGNDVREFIERAQQDYPNPVDRADYIRGNFQDTLKIMRRRYASIIKNIRSQNPTARIVLTTQYYPSLASWINYIYPFMKEVGRTLNMGTNPNNPTDVIHALMQEIYSEILNLDIIKLDGNILVADVTSSLSPFYSKYYVMQIEPSGTGGRIMARILQHIICLPPTTSGTTYRFFSSFFKKNKDVEEGKGVEDVKDVKDVKEVPFDAWVPKHPHEFTGKACYDPTQAIELLNKEKDEKKSFGDEERVLINKDPKLQLSLIVLYQAEHSLVTRDNFYKLLKNPHLQNALSAAHGYLNSGRFGFWRIHGRHGRRETEKFVRALMTATDYGMKNTAILMQEWIGTSNVHHSSRAFYADKSGLLESKKCKDSKGYATASSEERRALLTEMKGYGRPLLDL